jgi:hypothetical protein
MADRPIIFSTPMVRALLDGRKTMTRRLYKGRVEPQLGLPSEMQENLELKGFNLCGDAWAKPRYLPGDRLWVRESFAIVPATAYRMSEGVQQIIDPNDADMAAIYAAGWERSIPKWRPSIHMPRWASRLTLIVEAVKVERLQDISEADALAEGCFKGKATGRVFESCASMRLGGDEWACARDWYADLWERLHGTNAWERNPFVAAITFRTIRANVDTLDAEGCPLPSEEVAP